MLAIQHFDKNSQLAGFEPTRAEPIGFQVQRLNHSATTAGQLGDQQKMEMRGIEPRAFHMQSERSTTELHPRSWKALRKRGPGLANANGQLKTSSHPFANGHWPPLGPPRCLATFATASNVCGHIMLKTPVLVRSLKLSNIELC